MDQVNSLINKLAAASAQGADRLSLLAMVEEIRFQLMEAGKKATDTNAAISVWMPHAAAPAEKAVQAKAQPKPTVAFNLAVPRPPAVVVVEEEPVAEPEPLVPVFDTIAPVEAVADVPAIHEYVVPAAELVETVTPDAPAEQPAAIAENTAIPLQKLEAEDAAPEMVELNFSDPNEALAAFMPEALRQAPLPDPVPQPVSPSATIPEPAHFELALSEEMLKEIDALIKGEMPKQEAPPKEEPKELNEKIAQRTKVLNEVFDRKEPELAEVLAQPRITDLRKAISVAEKYQYINSLFRGDEDMFERSIRTINNFGILPEADYWVQRELIIKLGWNDEDELVQKFYSLVKRRFS